MEALPECAVLSQLARRFCAVLAARCRRFRGVAGTSYSALSAWLAKPKARVPTGAQALEGSREAQRSLLCALLAASS